MPTIMQWYNEIQLVRHVGKNPCTSSYFNITRGKNSRKNYIHVMNWIKSQETYAFQIFLVPLHRHATMKRRLKKRNQS